MFVVKFVQFGLQVIEDYNFEDLIEFIDWMLFFSSWQFKGKFLVILEDEVVGIEVKKLYNDVCSMFCQIIDEKWLMVKVVFGLFFVNVVGEEFVVVFIDEEWKELQIVFYFLCQ